MSAGYLLRYHNLKSLRTYPASSNKQQQTRPTSFLSRTHALPNLDTSGIRREIGRAVTETPRFVEPFSSLIVALKEPLSYS
jgi:hypothetical protein